MANLIKSDTPSAVVFDVDGVLTSGSFLYSIEGKVLKEFGPDDSDALGLLASLTEIRFVTGDRKGFDITRRRISEDMGFALDLVSTHSRASWLQSRYDLSRIVYVGDGIFDHLVMQKVGYAIGIAGALPHVAQSADWVTTRTGGNRAVAEAVLHLIGKFWPDVDILSREAIQDRAQGEWAK